MQTAADSSGAFARGVAAAAWLSPSHRLRRSLADRSQPATIDTLHVELNRHGHQYAAPDVEGLPDRRRINRTTNREKRCDHLPPHPRECETVRMDECLSGMLNESINQP